MCDGFTMVHFRTVNGIGVRAYCLARDIIAVGFSGKRG